LSIIDVKIGESIAAIPSIRENVTVDSNFIIKPPSTSVTERKSHGRKRKPLSGDRGIGKLLSVSMQGQIAWLPGKARS